MLERYVISSINILTLCGRYTWRTAVSRRMHKAYFRYTEGSEQYQLTFNVKDETLGVDRQFNFDRKASENVGSLLARINTNLDKIIEKNDKKKKKKQKKNNVEGEQSDDTTPKASCELLNKSESVPHDKICQDILVGAPELSLQICNITYQVIINSPWVDNLVLPSIIMAGFPVYPIKFETVFSIKSNCLFSWYSGNGKEWKKVGEGYFYQVVTDDIGKILKFSCIPSNGVIQGPECDVLSKNCVEAGPGKCPFETRHLFTSNRLEWPDFRVMSYNILADLYADSDVARDELYPYCPSYALAIDYRKNLIFKEIMGYNADIICLQEVDEKVYVTDLVPFLTDLQYDSTFSKKGRKVGEGVACFFHQSKFKLINSYTICLADELSTNPIFAELWELLKDNNKLIDRFKDRATCVSVTLLESTNDPNEVILVGNTHLYFHPDADHIRLLQAGMAVLFLEHFRAELTNSFPDARTTVIMCGDFNSTPDCGVYQLMTTQWIPDDYKDWKSNAEEAIWNISLSHTIPLLSACGTPEVTNYTVGFKGCLDYIFYQYTNLTVTQVIPFPSEEELKEHAALPSVFFPSDHIAQVCDLRLI